MSKTLAITFSIGIVCVAIAVAGIFYMQRGAHIGLHGSFLKVRTAPLDENSSAAVVDFRISNPSDYPFMVREVTMVMEDRSGGQTEGQMASDIDATRLVEGIPLLGPKYNDTLIERTKVPPHGTMDRMAAARFEIPQAKLNARKRLLIRIEEVDGPIVEIAER